MFILCVDPILSAMSVIIVFGGASEMALRIDTIGVDTRTQAVRRLLIIIAHRLFLKWIIIVLSHLVPHLLLMLVVSLSTLLLDSLNRPLHIRIEFGLVSGLMNERPFEFVDSFKVPAGFGARALKQAALQLAQIVFLKTLPPRPLFHLIAETIGRVCLHCVWFHKLRYSARLVHLFWLKLIKVILWGRRNWIIIYLLPCLSIIWRLLIFNEFVGVGCLILRRKIIYLRFLNFDWAHTFWVNFLDGHFFAVNLSLSDCILKVLFGFVLLLRYRVLGRPLFQILWRRTLRYFGQV